MFSFSFKYIKTILLMGSRYLFLNYKKKKKDNSEINFAYHQMTICGACTTDRKNAEVDRTCRCTK